MAEKPHRKSSILKTPKKARTPLLDVNTLSVNPAEDEELTSTTSITSHAATLRRRVSFAGTNLVKEFYSESECASVFHAPAYEEPLTMSASDSSGAPSDSSRVTSIMLHHSQHTLQTSSIVTQSASINIVPGREEDPYDVIMRQFGCNADSFSQSSKQPVRKARFSFGEPELNEGNAENCADHESGLEGISALPIMQSSHSDDEVFIDTQLQNHPKQSEKSSSGKSIRGSSVPVAAISSIAVPFQPSYASDHSKQTLYDDLEIDFTNATSTSEFLRVEKAVPISRARNKENAGNINILSKTTPISQKLDTPSKATTEENVPNNQCVKVLGTSDTVHGAECNDGFIDSPRCISTTVSVPAAPTQSLKYCDEEPLILKHASDSLSAPVVPSNCPKSVLNQTNYDDIEMDFTKPLPSQLVHGTFSLNNQDVSNKQLNETNHDDLEMEFTRPVPSQIIATISSLNDQQVSNRTLNQTNYDNLEMDFTRPVPSRVVSKNCTPNDQEVFERSLIQANHHDVEMTLTQPVPSRVEPRIASLSDQEALRMSLNEINFNDIEMEHIQSRGLPTAFAVNHLEDAKNRDDHEVCTSDNAGMFLNETQYEDVEMEFTKPLSSAISFPPLPQTEIFFSSETPDSVSESQKCDLEKSASVNSKECAGSGNKFVVTESGKATQSSVFPQSQQILRTTNSDKTQYFDKSKELTKCDTDFNKGMECYHANSALLHLEQTGEKSFGLLMPLSNNLLSKVSPLLGTFQTTSPEGSQSKEICEASPANKMLISGNCLHSSAHNSKLSENMVISVPTSDSDAITSQSVNNGKNVINLSPSRDTYHGSGMSSGSKSPCETFDNQCLINCEKTQVMDESMEFTEVLPGNIQEEFLQKTEQALKLLENGEKELFSPHNSHADAHCNLNPEHSCDKNEVDACLSTKIHTEVHVTINQEIACSSKKIMQPDISVTSHTNVTVLVEGLQAFDRSKCHMKPSERISDTNLHPHPGSKEHQVSPKKCSPYAEDVSQGHSLTITSGVKRDSNGRGATSPYSEAQAKSFEEASELLESECNPSKRICTSQVSDNAETSLPIHEEECGEDIAGNFPLVIPSSRSPTPERSLYDAIPALSPQLWKIKAHVANTRMNDSGETGNCGDQNSFTTGDAIPEAPATSEEDPSKDKVECNQSSYWHEVDIMNESLPSDGPHSSLETTDLENEYLHQSIAIASHNVEKMLKETLQQNPDFNASQNSLCVERSKTLPQRESPKKLPSQNTAPVFPAAAVTLADRDNPENTAPVLANNPRSLKEIIKENETKRDCLWNAHSENDSLWTFSFKCMYLHLKAHLNPPSGPLNHIVGKNASIVSDLPESSDNLLLWGRRILMPKLSSNELKSEYCHTTDFMNLVHKISVLVRENRAFLIDLIKLEGQKNLKISTDSLTFDVQSFVCCTYCVVKMRLDTWENFTPEHISLENRIGFTREDEIKELIRSVPKNTSLFRNYHNNVMEYVATLEALHKLNHGPTSFLEAYLPSF